MTMRTSRRLLSCALLLAVLGVAACGGGSGGGAGGAGGGGGSGGSGGSDGGGGAGGSGGGGGGPPPPPATITDLTITLKVAPSQDPLAGVQVSVARDGSPAIEPVTGDDGVAHIDSLEADVYSITLNGLPPDFVTSSVPSTVHFGVFFPKDLAYSMPLDLVQGPMVMFGDSDLSVPSGFRDTSIDDYLNGDPDLSAFFGWNLQVVNRSEEDTPVAYVPGADHYGLDQVRAAINEFPDMRFAFLRFGLNDVHAYLNLPTDQNIEIFSSAYQDVLNLLQFQGVTPILCLIHYEQRDDRHEGTAVANNVLRGLAPQYHAIVVESDFSYDDNLDLFSTADPDQVHLNDKGMEYVAGLTRAAILAFYTHGTFAQ